MNPIRDHIQEAMDARKISLQNSFTRGYMEQLKRQLGIESDYALAKALRLSKTTVSNYSNGRGYFSERVCHTVAGILRVDPAIVVASIEVDRRSNSAQQEIDTWQWIRDITIQMQRPHNGFANVGIMALLAMISIAVDAIPAWAALYFASFSVRVVCILC